MAALLVLLAATATGAVLMKGDTHAPLGSLPNRPADTACLAGPGDYAWLVAARDAAGGGEPEAVDVRSYDVSRLSSTAILDGLRCEMQPVSPTYAVLGRGDGIEPAVSMLDAELEPIVRATRVASSDSADTGPGGWPARLSRATVIAPASDLPVLPDGLRAGEYPCWPAGLWPAVAAVEQCESHSGDDPLTWDVNRSQSGRMQLDRATWEPYFLERGWTWDQVIFDQAIHFCAAWEIYQRAGGWGPWPNCQPW